MAKTQNYSKETREKAIRLVREHAGDYESEHAAIRAVAGRLGMSGETLRKWICQAQVDEGSAPGVSTEEAAQVRTLRRKVAAASTPGHDVVAHSQHPPVCGWLWQIRGQVGDVSLIALLPTLKRVSPSNVATRAAKPPRRGHHPQVPAKGAPVDDQGHR